MAERSEGRSGRKAEGERDDRARGDGCQPADTCRARGGAIQHVQPRPMPKLFFGLGLLLFGGFLRILVAHGWMVLSERKRRLATRVAAMATVCHIHHQTQVTDF